ncbi:MAG: hypothetical protein JO218_09800 [Burkholderiales bacterium]|nr:hypothetical protein [Burkholderiales bacterium]
MNGLRRFGTILMAEVLMRCRDRRLMLVLLMAAAIAWWCFPPKGASYMVLALDETYRGQYSSAWVGMTVAMTSLWIALAGFYLVRGSLTRDIDTQVWQLLAATPLRRSTYLLAKWGAHLTVLGLLVAAATAGGVAAQLVRAEDTRIDLVELCKPIALLAAPSCAITAMLSIWFDLIPLLRRTFGNVAYFCVWLAMLAATQHMARAHTMGASTVIGDPFGVTVFTEAARHAIQLQTGATASTDFCMVCGSKPGTPVSIAWQTWQPTPAVVAGRLLWLLLAAMAVAAGAALGSPKPSVRKAGAATQRQRPIRLPWLATLVQPLRRHPFGELFLSELQLMLRQRRRWWWAALAIVWCIQFFAAIDSVAVATVVGWLLLLDIFSRAALLERDARTAAMVFSADIHDRILRARWAALFALALLTNLPALLHSAVSAPATALAAVAADASLATAGLALGVLTGNGRTFELAICLLAYFAFNGGGVLNIAVDPLRTTVLHLAATLPMAGVLMAKWGRTRLA